MLHEGRRDIGLLRESGTSRFLVDSPIFNGAFSPSLRIRNGGGEHTDHKIILKTLSRSNRTLGNLDRPIHITRAILEDAMEMETGILVP